MAEHPIQGLMGVTIEKIRDMVDTSTIIGDPIHVDDTTTIIPVSRVTFGFASGGSDVAPQSSKQMFGGGGWSRGAACGGAGLYGQRRGLFCGAFSGRRCRGERRLRGSCGPGSGLRSGALRRLCCGSTTGGRPRPQAEMQRPVPGCQHGRARRIRKPQFHR